MWYCGENDYWEIFRKLCLLKRINLSDPDDRRVLGCTWSRFTLNKKYMPIPKTPKLQLKLARFSSVS